MTDTREALEQIVVTCSDNLNRPDARCDLALGFVRQIAVAALAAPPQATEPVAWAVEQWKSEVANRPLQNVHRRSLDGTWRKVIRHFGGDPDALLGPDHQGRINTEGLPASPPAVPAGAVTREEQVRAVQVSYARHDLEPTSETTLVLYRRDAEQAVDAIALLSRAPSDGAKESDGGKLQDDLRELLNALGMYPGAQPKSPHEVFQGALAELKRQLTPQQSFERVIAALQHQGGVNGDENSLTVGEIRRAL